MSLYLDKHYGTEVIAGVLDGVVTADDLDSEDYPFDPILDPAKAVKLKLQIALNNDCSERTI